MAVPKIDTCQQRQLSPSYRCTFACTLPSHRLSVYLPSLRERMCLLHINYASFWTGRRDLVGGRGGERSKGPRGCIFVGFSSPPCLITYRPWRLSLILFPGKNRETWVANHFHIIRPCVRRCPLILSCALRYDEHHRGERYHARAYRASFVEVAWEMSKAGYLIHHEAASVYMI